MPTEFAQATVTNYKKGNAQHLNNYRPMTSLSTRYNMFAYVLKHRIEKALEKSYSKHNMASAKIDTDARECKSK